MIFFLSLLTHIAIVTSESCALLCRLPVRVVVITAASTASVKPLDTFTPAVLNIGYSLCSELNKPYHLCCVCAVFALEKPSPPFFFVFFWILFVRK